jgi:c(7)-type cytochrome triheme protein
VARVALILATPILALAVSAAETELRLPPEMTLARGADSPAIVVFRHETHTAYAENRCVACHPQPFSILGRHASMPHREMDGGGSCGSCHDGRAAWATSDAEFCTSCHTGVEPPRGDVPPRSAPPDVRLARSSDSPGSVTFRHATHRAYSCNACHPEPFAARAGQTPLVKSEMLEGRSCGQCHDGKVAFGVDDMDRCESCHVTEGAEP